MLGLMRTTLNLDPEAIANVRLLAAQRRMTLGAVVSELILKALEPKEAPRVRNGMPLLPRERRPGRDHPRPDLELVNRLRDEQP